MAGPVQRLPHRGAVGRSSRSPREAVCGIRGPRSGVAQQALARPRPSDQGGVGSPVRRSQNARSMDDLRAATVSNATPYGLPLDSQRTVVLWWRQPFREAGVYESSCFVQREQGRSGRTGPSDSRERKQNRCDARPRSTQRTASTCPNRARRWLARWPRRLVPLPRAGQFLAHPRVVRRW